MAEQAFIGCADGVSISTASTAYYAPLGCGPAPGTILVTTEANVEHVHRGANVTLKRMYTRVQTNGRSTTSTVTIRKNAAGTALTSSITAAATGTISNLTDTVSLTAGDTYCVEVVLGTGTGNLLITGITLSMETSGQCIFPITSAGSQSFTTANVTRYQTPAGPLGAVQSTEGIVQTKALVGGVLSNLQLLVTANGNTNAMTGKSRNNAADGTQTFSIGAAATGRFEDTTNTDTIAADDLYDPAFVSGASTVSLTHSLVAFTYTPSTARRSQLNSRTVTSVLAASTTRYGQLMGRMAFNATEGNVQIVAPFDCRLSKLTSKVSVNASTTTVTVRLRVGGSNVNNILSIAGGATGQTTDGSNTDIVPAGSLINVIASGADGNVTFQGFSILVEEIVSYSLAAGAGAFVLTGQTVTLSRTRAIAAGAGSFSLTGQTVALVAAHRLSADVGAFTLTGQAVSLRKGFSLSAAVGSFVLSGQAVALRRGASLVAAVGSFVLTGQTVGLRYARRLSVGVGAFAFTGKAVTLSVSGPRTISAAVGSFTLTGQSVTLAYLPDPDAFHVTPVTTIRSLPVTGVSNGSLSVSASSGLRRFNVRPI